MFRFLTAGESHGPLLSGILEGMPAGVPIALDEVNEEMARRQRGYGRGGRMRIEKDAVRIVSGLRKGVTLGTPIGLIVENRDWANWQEIMASEPGEMKPEWRVTRPRPGHADLAGALKYGHHDIRNVLERASARETAMRVAVGGMAKQLLKAFGVKVISFVVEIGGIAGKIDVSDPAESAARADASEVRCPDPALSEKMIEKIREAKAKRDTLGGVFEVRAYGVPPGLGSYSQSDQRLNARLAAAVMAIQAIKGVEIGIGFEAARRWGSEVHDEIFYDRKRSPQPFYRKTNRAGGIEGGISNGEPILLRAAMKPIATLYAPLKSVDIETKEPFDATIERSDVCSVPAASVVGEAVVAIVLADLMREKFGGDSLTEMKRNYDGYLEGLRNF